MTERDEEYCLIEPEEINEANKAAEEEEKAINSQSDDSIKLDQSQNEEDILELDYDLDDDLTKEAKVDQKMGKEESDQVTPAGENNEESPAVTSAPFLWITGLTATVKANDIRSKLDATPSVIGKIKNIKGIHEYMIRE